LRRPNVSQRERAGAGDAAPAKPAACWPIVKGVGAAAASNRKRALPRADDDLRSQAAAALNRYQEERPGRPFIVSPDDPPRRESPPPWAAPIVEAAGVPVLGRKAWAAVCPCLHGAAWSANSMASTISRKRPKVRAGQG